MKNKECECGECDACIQKHIDFYEQLEQKTGG
jgi:7-cyano-7-deazaguanine synthase in queuosine biosynthesis